MPLRANRGKAGNAVTSREPEDLPVASALSTESACRGASDPGRRRAGPIPRCASSHRPVPSQGSAPICPSDPTGRSEPDAPQFPFRFHPH